VPIESGAATNVPIGSDADLVSARRKGRQLAENLGFSRVDATLVATVISELARNIIHHARNGEILIRRVDEGANCGIQVLARDEGPGIADMGLAMRMGYSSSGGLGLGLPGVRRIMDEFEIQSSPGRGTSVSVIRWRRR
jgi:serine/threonine-protein kinase RsbT